MCQSLLGNGKKGDRTKMNKVRVQTWNFRNELVDDKLLDVWTGLEDFLEDVYTRFSGGWQLKRIVIEKVRKT
jgi:hypothetical protein